MKPGLEYELFIFEKLERLYPNAEVRHDDHIVGSESGISRQIDVSVRQRVADEDVLYIVSCKDTASPADITVIGEFSAVIQDVKASKGFLLCSSGFAKTNYRYAQSKGIELLTIEDAQSDRWHIDIEIPLVLVRKEYRWMLDFEFNATKELVELNQGRPLTISIDEATRLSLDRGVTTFTLGQHIQSTIEDPGFEGRAGEAVDLNQPGLTIQIAGVWVPASSMSVVVEVVRKRFLKYMKPDEYTQLRDHVRGTDLPLQLRLSGEGLEPDGSYTEIPDGEPPVFVGFWVEAEQWTQIEGPPNFS